MNPYAATLCLLAAWTVAAPPLAAEPRSYTAENFVLDLEGEDAGWVRSVYARHSNGEAIGTEQLLAYLQRMQADGWDRARVEREIVASRPALRTIPAQPNMRVRCTGKPLRCESVPAVGAKAPPAKEPKETQGVPKP